MLKSLKGLGFLFCLMGVFFKCHSQGPTNQATVTESEACIIVQETKGNVEITQNIYFSPTDELEKQSFQLLDSLVKINTLTIEEKQQYEEDLLSLQEENRQLDSARKAYKQLMKFYEAQYSLLKIKVDSSDKSNPSYGEIQNLVSTYNYSIRSANCMAEELEVKRFRNPLGYYSYGFNRRAIENLSHYLNMDAFHEGMARARRINKYGFVSSGTSKDIPLKFEYAEEFSFGLALVKRGDQYYFINKEGEYVEEQLKNANTFRFGRGYAFIVKNHLWILVDTSFREILLPLYNFKYPNSDLYGSNLVSRSGRIDASFIGEVNDYGFAQIRRKNEWGYISVLKSWKGYQSYLSSFGYDKLTSFDEFGFAVFYRGGSAYLKDTSFSTILSGEDIQFAGNRLYYVKESGKWAMVNSENEHITRNIYTSFSTEFNRGFAIAIRNNKSVVINSNGLEVIPPIFDKVIRIGSQSFRVEKRNQSYIFRFNDFGDCVGTNCGEYYKLVAAYNNFQKKKD